MNPTTEQRSHKTRVIQLIKHIYLIEDSDSDAYTEGQVQIQEKMLQNHHAIGGGPGTEFTASIYDTEEDERMEVTYIYLGKHEFEDEQDYRENIGDVVEPLVEQYAKDSGDAGEREKAKMIESLIQVQEGETKPWSEVREKYLSDEGMEPASWLRRGTDGSITATITEHPAPMDEDGCMVESDEPLFTAEQFRALVKDARGNLWYACTENNCKWGSFPHKLDRVEKGDTCHLDCSEIIWPEEVHN